MKQNIKILAIETSCDETAAAVIGVENNQPVILSNIVSSQIDLHAKTGGVVPEVASRAHMESIIPVITEALEGVGQLSQITHIAVTAGPGLIGSLLVGFNTAKAMAYALDLPIIPISHIEGHIYSAFVEQITSTKSQITNNSQIPNSKKARSFPMLALTVSGGHTSLTLMRDHGVYETIGQTRDDAAGEAFDKVAKLLDLGYPGGPVVSKLADEFRKSQTPNHKSQISSKSQIQNCKPVNQLTNQLINHLGIIFPRPMIKDKSFDFSFSGLKTAVLDVVNDLTNQRVNQLTNDQKSEICAAFEDAAVDVLVAKTLRATEQYKPESVILAGGVAANKRLREELSNQLKTKNYKLILPPAELCGDNAAMIGLAAYYHIICGDIKKWNQIKIDSNLKL